MRDFRSTKDEHQREEEEAERLVRPQPKLKPPRKDRRREEMKVDRDPDTDADPDLKGDPDLSLNYKSIGGSDLRRFVRLALGDDKIKVKNTETDKVVMVSPETLKEQGSKYEKVEDEASKSGEQPVNHAENARALRELAKSDPGLDNKLKTFFTGALGYMAKENPGFAADKMFPGVTLPPGIKTLGDVAEALKVPAPKEPKKKDKAAPAKPPAGEAPKPAETPKAEPEAPKPAEAPVPSEAPKAEAPASAPAEPQKEAPKPAEAPAPAPSQPAADPLAALPPQQKAFLDKIVKKHQQAQEEAAKPKTLDDALKGVDVNSLPEPYKSAILAEQAKKDESKPKPEDKAKGEKPKTDKKPKKKTPEEMWPGRRKVDRAEIGEAQALVARHLPAKVAAKFMNLHPDDAMSVVAKFKGFKEQGPFNDEGELKSALAKLKKGFTLDPESIDPPKTWKTKQGEVPFESLSPEKQQRALSQHRTQVLAYGLAVRERAIETLARKGISRAAAAASVDLSLKKAPEPKTAQEHLSFYEKRRQRIGEVAKEHFIAAASVDSEPPLTPQARLSALEATRGLDADAQRVAVAKIQASDLREITEKYLTAKPSLGKRWFGSLISEREPVSKIIAKLNAATQDFDTLAKDYPSAARDGIEPKRVFRSKVLSRLKGIEPEKYEEVQRYFAKQDKDEYDHKKARYERDTQRYDLEYAEYEARFAKWFAKKQKAENGDSPYRSGKPKAFDTPPPEPPIKPEEPKMPAGYLEVAHADEVPSLRKSRNEMNEVEERLGLAQRVVNKVKSLRKRKTASLYSSYGYRDLTMGTPMPTDFGTRDAVYHGVEPDKTKSYPEWEQAHVCEMGSSDANAILAAAREWLKSSVLSKSIEGMPKDARFRAALDLAIRETDDGKYSGAINASTYNELLSKLSGDHSEPLGTIGRKDAHAANPRLNTHSSTTGKETKMSDTKMTKKEASEILFRLDEMAKQIQGKFASMGLDKVTAKTLVNDLDRVADLVEISAFGKESYEARRIEVLKQAKVLQQESDESYMGTFANPMKPHQTDADEKYMSAFKDDQSSAVISGKAENGKPLA